MYIKRKMKTPETLILLHIYIVFQFKHYKLILIVKQWIINWRIIFRRKLFKTINTV